MKKLITLFLFCSLYSFGQFHNGEELLYAMHSQYKGNYCQTVQFDQKTLRFDTNGVLKDTTRWYEWISYPDKFRIDFGKKYGGNCVIFKNDSSFSYKNHKLIKSAVDSNDLLLLLGGMYYREFPEVIARLKKSGYNLKKLKGMPLSAGNYFVIGDSGAHQIWVDKKELKVVEIRTKVNEKDWLQLLFYDFKKTCKGFTETKVTAKKNGKLEQEEIYLNLKTSIEIPDSIFNKR